MGSETSKSRLRGLVTLPTGAVAVIIPSDKCLRRLRTGSGGIDIDYEAGKFVADPRWRPDLGPDDRARLAFRWVSALSDGGLTEHEAMALIIAKDAPPFSVAREIVDVDDIPSDRRYRAAWRRSTNGGPIVIDEDVAQRMDEQSMWEAYDGSRSA